LKGERTDFEIASADVQVIDGSIQLVLEKVQDLLERAPKETIELIGGSDWHDKLRSVNVFSQNPKKRKQDGRIVPSNVGQITHPGIYVIPELSVKGLEFDNVIIANANDSGRDIDLEKNLRNVHFTRARKKLFVFYDREPSELLKQYYLDFIQPSLKSGGELLIVD
jgi:DNA helicase IV